MIDPRIKFPVGGPWQNPATGEIILNHAMTLGCFSSALANGQNVLTNTGDRRIGGEGNYDLTRVPKMEDEIKKGYQ
jgi:hypothetical protein